MSAAVARVNGLVAEMADVFTANHDQNMTNTGTGTWACGTATGPLPLQVGMQVKFVGDRRWWEVRATNEACVVVTRGGDFGRKSRYTVIVWGEGRRGPHVSWGHEAVTDDGCATIAADIFAGKLELSPKRSILLDLEKVR